MTSREVAQWLNKEATDEEYAEVFAYLYYDTINRKKSDSLTTDMMKRMNIKMLVGWMEEDLDEIINGQDICQGAWWKQKQEDNK